MCKKNKKKLKMHEFRLSYYKLSKIEPKWKFDQKSHKYQKKKKNKWC